MFLSVIIPAYNEEKRIGSTLESIDLYLKKKNFDYEIIVVANNCQDKTDEVVKEYQKNIPDLKLIDIKNGCGGKGGAVKIGVKAAKGDYILFMDADNSTRIKELDRLFPYFQKGFQIVIGSRASKGAEIVARQPIYREIAGKLANLIIRIVLGMHIHDTQCGFKIFTREAAKKIFAKQKITGWGFDMEVLALARKLGYNIKEKSIKWFNARESHVSLWNYFTTFWELFKIRWNLWTRKYD